MSEQRRQGDLWPPPYPGERFTEYDAPRSSQPTESEREVLTVAELGRAIEQGVQRSVPRAVWVEGEVVGSRPAASGHLYFTLKDQQEDAAIDVVMYRASLTNRTRAMVKDGARLRVHGRPAYWAQRGRLQFTSDRLELAGKGAILEAIERLKEKLAREGLFGSERKRPLPKDPRTVGVVTSAGGAVIHDICKVAARRGGAHVLLAPARVQGMGAAESITRSLRLIEKVATVDVIIVGRGGGSFDELLVWSDEALVRAVASCRVPIVSAVGHEVDVTLTDFAADKRAATPSQAAEMCVPDRAAWKREARHLEERLLRSARAVVAEKRAALSKPQRLLDARHVLAAHRAQSEDRARRLSRVDPRAVVAHERAELVRATERIVTLTKARVAREGADLRRLVAGLDAMSPLRVLSRGYAIATHEGVAVRDATEVEDGDLVTVRVHEGRFDAIVKKMRFVLLGDPVAHSKSPVMHAAAYRALGMDHTYEAVRVSEDELGAWVEKLRRGEIGGINVTVPHKRAALELADVVDATARACDACNVLAYVDGSVVAYNTDVAALAEELGPPASGTAIILGRGGAARAAAQALHALGATKIVTRARSGGDEPLMPTGSEKDARWIVQATSAGMTGGDPGEPLTHAVDFSLAQHALAYDVIYEPRQTPFLRCRARMRPTHENGAGMLARQGAIAFEIWLDVRPPLDVMLAAIQ